MRARISGPIRYPCAARDTSYLPHVCLLPPQELYLLTSLCNDESIAVDGPYNTWSVHPSFDINSYFCACLCLAWSCCYRSPMLHWFHPIQLRLVPLFMATHFGVYLHLTKFAHVLHLCPYNGVVIIQTASFTFVYVIIPISANTSLHANLSVTPLWATHVSLLNFIAFAIHCSLCKFYRMPSKVPNNFIHNFHSLTYRDSCCTFASTV